MKENPLKNNAIFYPFKRSKPKLGNYLTKLLYSCCFSSTNVYSNNTRSSSFIGGDSVKDENTTSHKYRQSEQSSGESDHDSRLTNIGHTREAVISDSFSSFPQSTSDERTDASHLPTIYDRRKDHNIIDGNDGGKFECLARGERRAYSSASASSTTTSCCDETSSITPQTFLSLLVSLSGAKCFDQLLRNSLLQVDMDRDKYLFSIII